MVGKGIRINKKFRKRESFGDKKRFRLGFCFLLLVTILEFKHLFIYSGTMLLVAFSWVQQNSRLPIKHKIKLSALMYILATLSSLQIHYLKLITAAALRSKLIFVLYLLSSNGLPKNRLSPSHNRRLILRTLPNFLEKH